MCKLSTKPRRLQDRRPSLQGEGSLSYGSKGSQRESKHLRNSLCLKEGEALCYRNASKGLRKVSSLVVNYETGNSVIAIK